MRTGRALLTASLMWGAVFTSARATIPIDSLAALPSIQSPELSPDGRQIVAYSVSQRETRLVFLNADNPGAVLRVVNLGKAKIGAIHWAGNGRLLIEIIGRATLYGAEFPVGRLIIYDIATGSSRIADKRSRGIYGGDVLQVDQTGNSAVVASQDDAFSTPSVKRIDLATGDATVIERAKPDVWDWFVDEQGVVRGGVAYDERKWKLWYRSKAGEAFRTIRGKFDKDDDSAVDRFYFSREDDKGTIVTNEKTGRFAAYRYDFGSGITGEVIFESPTADISEVIVDPGSRDIVGVRYHEDRWKTFWVDPKLKSLQARIDKALPNTDNRILGDPGDVRLLVWSGGANEPGTYFLFDRAKSTLSPVVQPYEKIDTAKLSPVKPIQYRARDGLTIPAYLTVPGTKPPTKLPLILMPHGGPFARDEWTYDPMLQFLASRGYAVLQPQFRGSTGYGKDFVAKGYGQWGRKMQDDLDDGVDKLIEDGIVDPKRVCILGGSYGGYAALWGVIRNPERYRCAVSVAGVTDLEAQLKENRKSFSATRYFRSWRAKVQGEDKFDLASVSPLAQSARIKAPVLIAHGDQDETVSSKQARKLVEALTARKADVSSVFYKDGGHDFSSSEDLADFFRRLESFLAKHNPA
jgi:dipeptidyl aminopeptidase/acylaminoacyl peptidase